MTARDRTAYALAGAGALAIFAGDATDHWIAGGIVGLACVIAGIVYLHVTR